MTAIIYRHCVHRRPQRASSKVATRHQQLSASCRQVPEAEAEVKQDDGAVSFLSAAVTSGSGAEALLSWRALRAVGVGFWLSDPHLLRCAASLVHLANLHVKPWRS